MKSRLIPILCLVAFFGVAVFLLGPWRKGPPDSGSPSVGDAPVVAEEKKRRTGLDVVKLQADPPAEPVVMKDMLALSDELNKEDASVEDDLSIVQELIRVFTRRVGTVPEGGLNYEIVQGLLGDNRMKLIFVAKDHARINGQGELVDRFGTPYDFHPVSSDLLEIRSAGPDKILETADDVEAQ